MSESKLFGAVRKELLDIPTKIVECVTKPLHATLKHATEVHSSLLEALQAGNAAGGQEEREALARYRVSVVAEISAYLLEFMQKNNAGATVGSVFTDCRQRLSQLVAEAPQEPLPPDGTRHSFRRRRTSVFKRLRRAGSRHFQGSQSENTAVAPQREFSPRQILESQLDEQIAADLLPIHESVQQFVAQQYAALESDVTEWAFGVLGLDDDFRLDDCGAVPDDGSVTTSKDETPRTADRSNVPAIERLTAAMERLSTYDSAPFPSDVHQQLEQVFAEVSASLPAVLQAPTKPFVRSKRRAPPISVGTEPVEWKKRRVSWVRWHTQALNRVRLSHSVLGLREEFARNAEAILCEVRAGAVEPVIAALEAAELWLDSARPPIEAAFDRVAQDGDKQLIDALEGVEREAAVELKRLFQVTAVRNARTIVTGIGIVQCKELSDRVAALPDDIVVHGYRSDRSAAIRPGRSPFLIDLREIATSVLTPEWTGLLTEAAEPLKARISKALISADQLQNVIDYNMGAAVEELQRLNHPASGSDGAIDGAAPPPTSRETARELAAEALRRSQELVDGLCSSLDEPWLALARAFDAEVAHDWRELVSQIESEDLTGESWIGLRARALRRAKQLKDQALASSHAVLGKSRKKSNVLRRMVTRLIRRGRTAVGLGDATEEDESTIADALRNAEAVRAALPLVYRRLFKLGDVADPSLLQGRGRDLVIVRRRFEKWQSDGAVGTLVLTGSIGGGRSSILEALRVKVFDECTVRSFAIEDRSTAARQLVEEISDDLSLPREARDWTGIEAELRRREAAGIPKVYIIDNLEHLMLQASGGTVQLQELLALMLRTDHAVFWLATMSTEAWSYFVKVAGMSAASVSVHNLARLGRDETEDVVLSLHHRSGITVRFSPPTDPSPILKRRLRRTANPERKQEILQEVFFDAVYKNTGGQIGLTLLYWLRSVEFENDGDVVTIKPLQPLCFEQLNRLDLPRLFSLKAFVLHNTLTAGELAQILRTPMERAALIIEALLRFAVIERFRADGAEPNGPVDCVKERFRMSRLVVHPVGELLRSARILY